MDYGEIKFKYIQFLSVTVGTSFYVLCNGTGQRFSR